MDDPMTRRHWLRSLFASLAGAWAAGRPRPAARPTAPPWRPAPVEAAYPCGTYTYVSGAIPLGGSAPCDVHLTVTTCSYSAAAGDSGGV